MTPAPGGSPAVAKRPIVKAHPKAPQIRRQAPVTPGLSGGTSDSDKPLTPAEVMDSLSGKQLEVFQMVMTRMEKLEKENQELMQILLQMQGLLQQQQQRNARLQAGQPGVAQ